MCIFLTGGGAMELILETPNIGQITIHYRHNKCANFHNIPTYGS